MPKKRKNTETPSDSLLKNKKSNDDFSNELEITEHEDHLEMVYVPNPDDSGDSGDESNTENRDPNELDNDSCFLTDSYGQMTKNYTESQKKLEENHEYDWINGEKIYGEPLTNTILLSDNDRKNILASSLKELFEYFFSKDFERLYT